MKKRIFSVFTALLLFVFTFGLSACGNKYKNMEFSIQYAFSENATDWFDANDGIVCNYGGEDDPLRFDTENSVGYLYVRVEIKGVKAKHIDDIIVTKTGTSGGLDFNTVTIKQNQVIVLPISDNVQTSLNFFETNSGNSKQISLSVYRSLQAIDVDTSIIPAVVIPNANEVNQGLNLKEIKNLTYQPAGKTNQTGVKYSVESFGAYSNLTGTKEYVATKTSNFTGTTISDGGVLRVTSAFDLSANQNIIRIKATSRFNENISAVFDVFVVDKKQTADLLPYSPEFNYLNGNEISNSVVDLYNSDSYNTVSFVLDYTDLASIYKQGILTAIGNIAYKPVVYVDNEKIDLQAQEIANGLLIKPEELDEYKTIFTVTSTDSHIKSNSLRFGIELEGANFFNAQAPIYEHSLQIVKHDLPNSIIVNGNLLQSGESADGIVYGTDSLSYLGLKITPEIFPSFSTANSILIESAPGTNSLDNLILRGVTQTNGAYSILSGESFYAKFKDNVSPEQKIVFKVLQTPEKFMEQTIAPSYISVTYVLKQKNTANLIEIYSDEGCNNQVTDSNLNINANGLTSFYLKLFYNGGNLDEETITLNSSNERIKFSNNQRTLTLSSNMLVSGPQTDTEGRSYSVYKVDFASTQQAASSTITVQAGDEVGVSAEFAVSSVYLLEANSLTVQAVSDAADVQTFSNLNNGSYNFAVIKNKLINFEVRARYAGGQVLSNLPIKDIKIVKNLDFAMGAFDANAVSFTRLSTNEFSLTGNIGGKTQVLILQVSFYQNINGQIVETVTDINVEIAVYDPITRLELSSSKNSLVYVNSKFKEESEMIFDFRSYTSGGSKPSSVVVFSAANGGTLEINRTNTLSINFNRTIDSTSNVEIYLLNEDNSIASKLANEEILLNSNQEVLNGKILVRVIGDVNLANLDISLQALRFGSKSNITSTRQINFPEYEKVDRVTISGENIVNNGINSNYIYLSFINTEAGGKITTEFNAQAGYKSNLQTGTRIGKLDFVLYQVEQDKNGNIVIENGQAKIEKINVNHFVISLENNIVTLSANKNFGGGLFKLVIVPMDAYDDNSNTYDETNGTAVFLSIADGKINRYVISSEEDLKSINNDLTANYVLGADISVSQKFVPVGLKNGEVIPFSGSLFGTSQNLDSNNSVHSVTYSINSVVKNSVLDANGNVYAGLFAILGEKAEISNLIINTSFATDDIVSQSNSGALFIGALAGLNNGKISNIQLSISGNVNLNNTISTPINFGGLVGSNNGVIFSNGLIDSSNKLTINSISSSAHNIGLIAGKNYGEIYGRYKDKELNSIEYDVIANLIFNNNCKTADPLILNLGSITGENKGYIHNFIVGGLLEVNNSLTARPLDESSYIGGIVGSNNIQVGSSVLSKGIDSCTALGLSVFNNTVATAAGIAGYSQNSNISLARVISANVMFNNSLKTTGSISGGGVVAGIVANSNADQITNATVENFILGVKNSEDSATETFYTLKGAAIYGLAKMTGGSISNSFVKANLSGTAVYATANGMETDTYFVGEISGTKAISATYSVVYNSEKMEVFKGDEKQDLPTGYLTVKSQKLFKEIEVTEENFATLKDGLYIFNNPNYELVSVDEFDPTTTYYVLDSVYLTKVGSEFVPTKKFNELYYKNNNGNYVQAKIDEKVLDRSYVTLTLDKTIWNNFISGLVNLEANSPWSTDRENNSIKIQNLSYYFPYLTLDSKPLMIVQPTEITADINSNYVIETNSIYIPNELNYGEYEFSSTSIINYHNVISKPLENNRYNKHYIVNKDRNGKTEGLVNLTVVPEDALGGVKFQIVSGGNFAYISDESIVFTGASGNRPIIVRAYSAFNEEIEEYFAFFSQPGMSKLMLESSNIININEKEDGVQLDYELTTFMGQSANLVTLSSENIFNGQDCATLLDVANVDNFVSLDFTLEENTAIQITKTSALDSIRLATKADTNFEGQFKSEIVEFTLKLNLTAYFGEEFYPQIAGEDQFAEIISTYLKVVIFKSATGVQIDGGDLSVATESNNTVNATLYTGYAQENIHNQQISNIKINGDVVEFVLPNSDSINLEFNLTSGQAQLNRVLNATNKTGLAELFDYSVFYSSAMRGNVLVGYDFNINFSLKDEFDYRYFTESISFDFIVSAKSNSAARSSINIEIEPTPLRTLRIANYAAADITNNGYVGIMTKTEAETSIISPGGFGGVMLLYLEPSYANIKTAVLSSSELFVPSLNRNVRITFEQLVYNPDTGRYQTLPVGGTPLENGALQLQLVSEINNNGESKYNGIIYIHSMLDKFQGLKASISATLTVTTGEDEVKSVTKPLITQFLPGVSMNFDGGIQVPNTKNEYIVQKDTPNNEVSLQVFGYQFNSNPTINATWKLGENNNQYIYAKDSKAFASSEDFESYKANGKIYTFDGTKYSETNSYSEGTPYYVDNHGILWKIDGTGFEKDGTKNKEYMVGDYVSTLINRDFNELVPNQDGSYTIKVSLFVDKNIPASFELNSSITLADVDSFITATTEQSLVFHPTDIILENVGFKNLNNGTINVIINNTRKVELGFNTKHPSLDESEVIFFKLIKDLTAIDLKESDSLTDEAKEKLLSLFTYSADNGEVVSFKDKSDILFPEIKQDGTLTVRGTDKFNKVINVSINYSYKEITDNNGVGTGEYELVFSESGGYLLQANFTLNIYPSTTEKNAFPITSAEDMFDESGRCILAEGENYILLNDITLENIQPIDVRIASLDGNNRKIKIKSFAVSTTSADYGLFAQISNYEKEDKTYQTILKNVVVDYSEFNEPLLLTNNEITNIRFGGLVAHNNGGLIYNCDVVNTSATNAIVNVVVDNSENVNITFGGLVGENNGIITNSRVGRKNFTKISVSNGQESSRTESFGALTFVVGNNADATSAHQNFVSSSGAFVGKNSGTISSSYVANTSLINYSADLELTRLAGFVGENTATGTIAFSYVKAMEDTITSNHPNSTGAKIESRANVSVAGFVHTNSGYINNSFANTALATTSAYLAGFVYTNNQSGMISECYAACTMNSTSASDVSEQPFVGINNANEVLSFGTIKNSYYLLDSSISEMTSTRPNAVGLNETNFADSNKLNGFVFVQSNSASERAQGVWSYYNAQNSYAILPELNNANKISHSFRYLLSNQTSQDVNDLEYTNAYNYELGSENNPFIIRSVEEFNEIMTQNRTVDASMVGYVRMINNINFGDTASAIQTRVKFTLGDNQSSLTSLEGNGMTISGIYLDVTEERVEEIGLFAKMENAYVKNLNLEFASTIDTGDQSSSVSAQFSGGLAGKIDNSVIINIKLNGANTTIAGQNFAGGLAGIVTGNSMIHGVESNLNVRAVKEGTNQYYMYYNDNNFNRMKEVGEISYGNYSDYTTELSFAGGIAGVIDIETRQNVKFNLSNISVLGDKMANKTQNNGNISADYAGGVAGYMSEQTNALRLKFNVGKTNLIKGRYSVGGLFAVALGNITASQVTAEESEQYVYDTTLGEYIIKLNEDSPSAELDSENIGNTNLLEGYNYVGGLVGIGLNATVASSYSKASVKVGKVVGGLFGVSVASKAVYSYAVPFINNINTNSVAYREVGGLIGSAYAVERTTTTVEDEIKEYSAIVIYLKNVTDTKTDLQFTFSTLLLDNSTLTSSTDTEFDYFVAKGEDNISSNKGDYLIGVFVGTANYLTTETTTLVKNRKNVSSKALNVLFDLKNYEQRGTFDDIFSAWDTTYWTLDNTKYFPLLLNERVDNYYPIDDPTDFNVMINNPDGSYKIVEDINLNSWCENNIASNFVFDVDFTGILIGEKEDGSIPTVSGLYVNTVTTGNAGLFKSTQGATLRNIRFSWNGGYNANNSVNSAIQVNHNLEFVGGLSAADQDSVFTNITVDAGNKKDNYFVNNNTSSHKKLGYTVQGVGGLIGYSSGGTIINNCQYSGNMDLKLGGNQAYVGGLVAWSSGNANDPNSISSISSAAVTRQQDRTQALNTEISATVVNETGEFYFGGAVGKIDNANISAVNIGDANDTYIKLKVNTAAATNYIGGLIGKVDNCVVNSNFVNADLNVTGDTKEEKVSSAYLGGFIGQYVQGSASSNCRIVSNTTNVNIKTYTSESDKLSATNLSVSLGIGHVSSMGDYYCNIEKNLFAGLIDTKNAGLTNVYAGGLVAMLTGKVHIQESMAKGDIVVGSTETTQLYAGGLLGGKEQTNEISSPVESFARIENSTASGKLVPISREYDEKMQIKLGGLVGVADNLIITNSISTVSIITSSLNPSVYQAKGDKFQLGALVGEATNVSAENVYYSSDLALAAEEVLYKNAKGVTNLAASLLYNAESWHSSKEWNDIWAVPTANDSSKLPYIKALESSLIQIDILTENGNTLSYRGNGTSLNPNVITATDPIDLNSLITDGYNILSTDSTKVLPLNALTKEFNGILIGGENFYTISELKTIDNYTGLIPVLGTQAAVSNLHISLPKTLNLGEGVNGLIVGNNQGVVFNSSVGGTGATISAATDTNSLGLIVGYNQGVVADSFADAEITSVNCSMAGIVATNDKLIDGCYFTGYINNATAYGIVGETTKEISSHIYNSYMAGVIAGFKASTTSTDGTSSNFTANSFAGSDFFGKNNFIDKWANFDTVDPTTVNKETKLQAIDSEVLMAGSNFVGSWHTSMKTTTSAENKTLYYVDTQSATYGHNFLYPVHNFHKFVNNGGDFVENSTQFAKYTGTGSNVVKISVSNDLTSSLGENEGTNKIADKLDKNFGDKEGVIKNIFKIPHLGVLRAVQYLANTQFTVEGNTSFVNPYLNYALIYDVEFDMNFTWQSVGRTAENNNTVLGSNQFNGTFISNKYFSFEGIDSDSSSCTITNLNGSGLFDNINRAHFGYINFAGEFTLANSGILGANVKSITNASDESSTETPIDVAIQNIKFDEANYVTISGTNVGVLFGVVTAGNISSSGLETKKGESFTIKLKGSGKIGFLASSFAGGSYTNKDTDSKTKNIYVQLNAGNNSTYSGGLVGEMTGGTINFASNELHIFTHTDATTQVLGGIVGTGNGGTVNGVTVCLPDEIYAASFGGLVGRVETNTKSQSSTVNSRNNSTFEFNACQLNGSSVNVLLKEGNSNNFGLVAGDISTDITVKDFSLATSGAGANPSYTVDGGGENQNDQAYGVLAGKISGGTLAFGGTIFGLTLKTTNSKNTGGIIGHYAGGKIEITAGNEYKVTISGENNVGGAFGFVSASLDSMKTEGEDDVWNFLTEGGSFATIDAKDISKDASNWGGLIGESTQALTNLINGNSIIIGTASESITITNIGGVVGLAGGDVTNCKNNGAITLENGSNLFNSYADGVLKMSSSSPRDDSSAIKTLNVGGVVGGVGDSKSILTNLINTADVQGYQNVGGLVGYLGSATLSEGTSEEEESTRATNASIYAKIANNTVLTEGNLYFTKDGEDNYTAFYAKAGDKAGDNTYELSNIAHNSSEITGAINVGGAVGLMNGGTVSNIRSSGNVNGNASVGGLVGYVAGGAVSNSVVKALSTTSEAGVDAQAETAIVVTVKGITVALATVVEDNQTAWDYATPTSVGGLVGTANANVKINNNLSQTFVTSTNEGVSVGDNTSKNSNVISTNANYMVEIRIGTTGSGDESIDSANAYDYLKNGDRSKLDFNNIKSGFGGFIGSATKNDNIKNNFFSADVNAQLGVNVGAVYGFYSTDGPINNLPTFLEKSVVNGAYNIGSVIGYVRAYYGNNPSSDISFEAGDNLKLIENKTIVGTLIDVQTQNVGMYVGGLFGKLEGNAHGLKINTANKIAITTTNSYYVGGLVGRLEGNLTEIVKYVQEDG